MAGSRAGGEGFFRHGAAGGAGGGEKAAPIPVAKADIDYNRHVNNACYIRMAEELLPDWFQVRGLRVEYRVPAKFGDVLLPEVFRRGNAFIVSLSLGAVPAVLVEFT